MSSSNANNCGGKMSIILKAVFPLLEGTELASCMGVCKQWGNAAEDDYLWKCLCVKKWPSLCKKDDENNKMNYRQIFKAFCIREKSNRATSLAPGMSLSDLEFYVDIRAADGRLLFSESALGPDLREGNLTPPPGVVPGMMDHLEGPEYKLTFPVKSFSISSTQEVRVSVLIARKDSNKAACILNQLLDCNSSIDLSEGRAVAYAQIAEFPLACPFVNFATSSINGEISLLFVARGEDQPLDVFGIEMNFLTAYAEEGVLWLLSMLDWQ